MYTSVQARTAERGFPAVRSLVTLSSVLYTHPLFRYDRSEISSPHTTRSTLIHLECHTVVPMYAGKQRDASQSRHHQRISHTESWRAEVVHVDDDVAIFVVDVVQRQEPVSFFREDGAEEGSNAFDDAEVELGLRDALGKLGEDEAGLRAGDVEGDAVVQSFVLQGGWVGSPFCSADVRNDRCFATTYTELMGSDG